jgi:hypothetical protein
MKTETRKTLNDVGGIPDALQQAYEATMAYDPDRQQVSAVTEEALLRMASQEGSVNGLKTSDGITPGLRSLLRQAGNPSLSAWLQTRRDFDTAIAPFMDQIEAARHGEEKRIIINQQAAEAEQTIVREAETHKPYADARQQKEAAELHFQKLLQGEGGRPVTTFGHTYQYFVLLAAITSIEWLINYESLEAWLGLPFLAWGGTIILAAGVGVAAHYHGTYLKQWTSRFAPHEPGKGRYIGILIAVTAALLVVIGVAGWARFSLATHSSAPQGPMIPLDQLPSQPNPTTDVLVSLGFNLLVWLIGVAVAFFAHDENHELMRAELEQWRKRRIFNRLHRPWEKRIALARAHATHELNQLRAATELALDSTKPQRDMLERVDKHEELVYRHIANQIQAVVDLYRIALGRQLATQGYTINLVGQSWTGQQYQQTPITVDARSMRVLLN